MVESERGNVVMTSSLVAMATFIMKDSKWPPDNVPFFVKIGRWDWGVSPSLLNNRGRLVHSKSGGVLIRKAAVKEEGVTMAASPGSSVEQERKYWYAYRISKKEF